MKKLLILLLPAAVILAGYFIYIQVVKPALDNRTVTDNIPMTVRDSDFGFEYTYLSGETAYTQIDPPVPSDASDGLKKASIIMDNRAYQDFSSATDAREAPPAVTIFVLKEIKDPNSPEDISRMDRLKMWAEKNPQYTSYSLKTSEPELIEIDGVRALHYRATGLYEQDIYLLNNRGYIYVFIGQYQAETDDIVNMFRDLIGSLVFD